MAGTKAGGLKASETNKKMHGEDFYKRIGQMGGHNGHTGGFASNPTLARLAGAKGGRMSKRGASVKYSVYEGDRIVCAGTLEEVAEMLGYTKTRICHCCTHNKLLGYKYTIKKTVKE